jgi:hypothetical protein
MVVGVAFSKRVGTVVGVGQRALPKRAGMVPCWRYSSKRTGATSRKL